MSNSKDTNLSWGGRFNEATDAFVARFTASVDFDQRLAPQDIQGSIAHATMLTEVGVLNENELESIKNGLTTILTDIENGTFEWSLALEDVHMNVEAALTSQIGITGKKLHTGRSRNDQVATDIRLWLRHEIDAIGAELTRLQQGILGLAKAQAETIMPGFTHLQTAQPVTFGHHLMAWFEMLERDYGRLLDCRKRLNQSPLGAAALAGTTYPIDRYMTADLLGFDGPTRNSLDSVSDRDFAIEFCAFSSILLTHLSRASEELILWTSAQFDTVDTVKDCLRAFADMIPAIQPKKESMREAARRGFSTATDLADYLVRKGIPFRDSHEIVGKSVAFGIAENKDLSDMSLEELRQFSTVIETDVFDVLTLEGSVAARNHIGGTAPEQVRIAVQSAAERLSNRT